MVGRLFRPPAASPGRTRTLSHDPPRGRPGGRRAAAGRTGDAPVWTAADACAGRRRSIGGRGPIIQLAPPGAAFALDRDGEVPLVECTAVGWGQREDDGLAR